MKTFELYNDGKLLDTANMTQEQADDLNSIRREGGNGGRWIELKKGDLPSNYCSCGASYSYECVCY